MPTNKQGYRGMTFESDLFTYGPYNPNISNSYNDSFNVFNGGYETATDEMSNPGKVSQNASGLPKDITSPTVAPRVLVANWLANMERHLWMINS